MFTSSVLATGELLKGGSTLSICSVLFSSLIKTNNS
ncbi:hypothetical protein NC651_025083 [Populus alba x Populus x berolinensis]|nr:hypothetical protein NC651_025083 [Populus alba x Populus x berolinensis]